MARKKTVTHEPGAPATEGAKGRKKAPLAEVPLDVADAAMAQCVAAIGALAMERGLSNIQARELFHQTLRVSRSGANALVWNFTFGR